MRLASVVESLVRLKQMNLQLWKEERSLRVVEYPQFSVGVEQVPSRLIIELTASRLVWP